jgi:hypothetical protein
MYQVLGNNVALPFNNFRPHFFPFLLCRIWNSHVLLSEFCNLDVDNISRHPNYVDTNVLNFRY